MGKTNSGSFTSKQIKKPRQGKRGADKRGLTIAALERKGKSEDEILDILVKYALSPRSKHHRFGLEWIAKRLYPEEKAVLPLIKVSYPQYATKLQKADAIINAISSGKVPADIGKTLLDALNVAITIEEVTDLKTRLEYLEGLLNGQEQD